MTPYTPARTHVAAALIAGALAASATPAPAALVELTFSGQVTEILGAPHGQWANVVLGDDFMIRIVVDSKAEDQIPGSAALYFYESATITVGGYSVSTGTGPFNHIVVDPFGGLFGNDRFEIQYHNPEEQWQGGISLQGPNVFQNDLLPIDLDLEAFTFYKEMGLSFPSDLFAFRSSVDSYTYNIIPHPGTLTIIFSTLLLPRCRRRKG